jgi:hypothetical protein
MFPAPWSKLYNHRNENFRVYNWKILGRERNLHYWHRVHGRRKRHVAFPRTASTALVGAWGIPVFMCQTIGGAATGGHEHMRQLMESSIKRERHDEINFCSLWREELRRLFLQTSPCRDIAKREELNQLKFSMPIAECIAIDVECWRKVLMGRGLEWVGDKCWWWGRPGSHGTWIINRFIRILTRSGNIILFPYGNLGPLLHNHMSLLH